MRINDLGSSAANLPRAAAAAAGGQPEQSFSQALQDSIEQVSSLEDQADELVSRVAAGDLDAVHQAMVAMEKASLALDFTVQVRNKVIEAYQELMRTQV